MNFFIIDELGFEPESKLLFSYMTVEPSSGTKRNINTLIRRLKADNIWQYLDRLWVMAAISNQHARLNWKNPAANNLTLVNSPTFTSRQGYAGNGTTSYLNTNFKPSDDGNQYTQNNASYGIYSRTNSSGSTCGIGTRDSATNLSDIFERAATDEIQVRINSANTDNLLASNTNSQGLFAAARTTSSASEIFKNGVSLDTSAELSALSGYSYFIGARNGIDTAESFSTRQYAMAFIGSGDINQLSFYNAFQSYMTVLGTQV